MSGPPEDPNGGCPHLPGSPGKVEWLERRMSDGWALWHEDDARNEDAATLVEASAAAYQPLGHGNPRQGKFRASKNMTLHEALQAHRE